MPNELNNNALGGGSLLLRRRAMMMRKAGILPAGFTELLRLESKVGDSSVATFINTGFIPNNDTRCVIKYSGILHSSYSPFFGVTGIGWGGDAFYAYHNFDNYGDDIGSQVLQYDGQIHTIDKNKNLSYRDDIVEPITTHPYTNSVNPTSPMYLFACNYGYDELLWYYGGGQSIYFCKIYDNGVLVRDYIPALRTSDSKPGMYDIVNKVFYTNQGTGEFGYETLDGTIVNPV